ncbi:MAG TPA: hypothetical protein VHQ64_14420, partial [Pyrinomonadaceae bacterium]|nr:hypothetical protein [Pyrinomonadaceae bacterium]
FAPLIRVVDEFAEAIVAEKPGGIAGDAIEGFNPAHDACRMIINAAVTIAGRALGPGIVNQDFLLVGRHTPLESDGATNLLLDDVTFERKLAAARSFTELAPELDAVLQGDLLALHQYPQISNDSLATRNTIGAEAYRVECLRPVGEPASLTPSTSTPFYEQYGELRVAEGLYGEVIRYRDHMLPLAEALSEHAATF